MDKKVTFLTEKQIDKNRLLRRLKDDSVKVSKSDDKLIINEINPPIEETITL